MKKISAILLALAVSLTLGAFCSFSQPIASKSMNSNNFSQNFSNNKPNFAFPDKVATDADKLLKRALDNGNGQETVTSLVCYSLARNAVSTTLLPPVIERIDSIRRQEKDTCVKSLLSYLEAVIYNGIYSSDKWKYDHREIPAGTLSADYTEWSGDQFKKKISELLQEALIPAQSLIASPINDWKDIVIIDETSTIFYPTLFDFIAYNAIDIYQNMAQSYGILPIRFLEPTLYLDPIPSVAIVDSYSRNAHDLCTTLAQVHRDRPASEIMARIKAIECMSRLTYQDGGENPVDSAYVNLYREFADTEWGAEALLASPSNADKQSVAILKRAISKFPNYIRVNALKQRVAEAEQKSASFKSPNYVTPGKPFEVNVTLENTDKATLYIYRSSTEMTVEPSSLKITPDVLSNLTGKYEISVSTQEMPFSTDTIVPVTIQKPGYYYIWITYNGQDKKLQPVNSVIKCSDIAPLALGSNGLVYPYAVSSSTGEPQSGVTVSSKPYNKSLFRKLGTTISDGTLPQGIEREQNIMIERGASAIRFSAPWSNKNNSDGPTVQASIFTDLPLYHHGDSVDWVVVSYITDNGKNHINNNARLSVKLTDVNNTEIDKKDVITDASGRAAGKFTLPVDGLSGFYRLQIYEENGKRYIGSQSITVNDYKLPTFEATVADIKRSNSRDSLVTVTSRALTYSGFPVGGAQVKVRLEAISRFWWYNQPGKTFWICDTVTNSDGSVTINLSDEILSLSPMPKGLMRITFDITSPGGETQTCSSAFTTGKPYSIIPFNVSVINLDNEKTIKVSIIDALGKEVSIPLLFKIMSDSNCIASFNSDEKIPAHIAPGMYDIKIVPIDQTLADEAVLNNVVFYRDKGASPVKSVLFLPEKDIKSGNVWVDIPLGCGKDNANILVSQSIDGRLERREWFKPICGMQYYRVEVPSNCNQVEVVFLSMYDNDQQTGRVLINNTRNHRNINIEVESFRDKVVPGESEKITIRVKENGQGTTSSVIMGMLSKSILALAPYSLDINLVGPSYPRISVDGRSNYLSRTFYTPVERFSWPTINQPELQLYGMSYGDNAMYYSKRMRLKTATTNGIVDEIAVCEDGEVAMGSATMLREYATAASADAAYSQDEVIVESPEEESMDVTTEPDNFNYRPSELPLAFFAPMLQTEPDGTLTYTYTVPEANTTWALKALAYTPDMLTSSIERATIASRPVMVNATTPRFLRYGDHITLRATVMNNTDSTGIIKTVMTVINATDMSEIASKSFVNTINGGASDIVSLPLKAPSDGQAILVRVKSQMDNYADGEQALIPLLPVSQPVITSQSFYVPYSTDSISMTFSGIHPEARTTLYLYDNPLWEVITALPSLDNGENITSTGAMNLIYMASIAKGIMEKNTALKQALTGWLKSDRSDSTLTSIFKRNEDLKQLTLNATPWVREAMNDSERLSALALMLDEKNLNNIIKKAIKTLGNCVANDNGLTWCQGSQTSSLWATYRVLALAASLQERGYMPSNDQLKQILTDAVSYIDTNLAEQLKRDKNSGDYTQYAYIRSLFKNIPYTTASIKAINITIANILKRWEKESTQSKGIDAIILYHNNYPSMARRVVASIKAYSMNSPEKGTWWDRLGVDITASLLYTIETVTPADRDLIQSVAQWLIINKTNQAWDNQAATSATIDALLGAIDIKKAVKGETHVTVNGHELTDIVSQMPGMTVAGISSDCKTGAVTVDIKKTTSLPAMGSVISQAIVPMNEIKSTSHQSVSIEKRYNVVKGTLIEKADTLNTGDRVKVQLVINVKDDLEYVTIIDRRSACMEPVEQLSRYMSSDGLWYYREMTDSETRYFISWLPKGTYVIDTNMNIMATGEFASGVATLQSQLNPGVTANSSSEPVIVK